MRHSLVYSQRMLRESINSSWQGRWAAAFGGGEWRREPLQGMPCEVRAEVSRRVHRLTDEVVSLRRQGGPGGIPCSVPDVSDSSAFAVRRGERCKEEDYAAALRRLRDGVAEVQATLRAHSRRSAQA